MRTVTEIAGLLPQPASSPSLLPSPITINTSWWSIENPPGNSIRPLCRKRIALDIILLSHWGWYAGIPSAAPPPLPWQREVLERARWRGSLPHRKHVRQLEHP
jgi:hypothetical protein